VAIMVMFEVPGLTAELYDQMAAAVTPIALAAGSQFHAAGPDGARWRVVEVWPSREAFDSFIRETITPMMVQAGMPMPEIKIIEIHNVVGLAT
jgi:hypothetical protein